ncbi:period circadian protein homolog 2 isoform X1 [Varanus komodoensis]|uniref:period circadian protein homolog 2 isoform X1 n=1 Tax=Varanus komodoensis TaxID=61221 RepID=UPI001CF7B7F3|nr:period circadian protein homolog 2 isoform X1 [Varanus komodoensis]XP_044288777.1 period circadian protein homolog 2 isoform X1 [Varanus komodoensis]XP_044288778.1 period circadian protein homolog 2 isoform X1 [Varanus komodoensis]XP_044288779.1 period circadian protein homolog 2 isoform X1 [Varanus komodoensis]XP_044288781.1 period circadian protein homolog 2 isoform X1 [Varanus komodoensis]XP_044288782.1 period circadian protein homolog 2 isoform X1 [Varanus komodoensis]XP_044288783.1 pe
MANDKMIVENMDIQMKTMDALQEDIEMNGGSSANDNHENYFNGHDSHSNEGEENGKETAMIMESLDCYKSTELSSKSKIQKELIKTLQELKGHLPPDRRLKGKSSILATLKYALRSIKQVKANEEYYQLMMINESHPCSLDVFSYTVEDVENITTEYIMKNADMFAVAVSLVTGKILYISDQAASILHCKKDRFKNAKFVEFLAPQDVSVFYSSTTPYRLPSWSICNGVESATQECIEEKSFFCRISTGKEHINEICYQPFRMTPYLIKAQDAEEQLCCVLLAEKVHSGYEAPRIPPNKRVFTTTHTPGCLFQDIDERAVPLLGYLPQDLIGTPVLVHLHPSDRPLMLAIHKKILQCGGQPFDYSPIRFCTRNGEYITLDTSWSSFINPWSRKISFIIGRHKVRTGPLNEDVFAPHCTEEKILHPSIQEITEQIHRLLLQPVHNSGSSGYGSLGSNGSHEHLMSVASSSDSNGNNNEDTQRIPKPNSSQDICKNGRVAKNKGEHAFVDSRSKLENQKKSYGEKLSDCRALAKGAAQSAENDNAVGIACQRNLAAEELAWGEQPAYSYQQISCLDSVIRYLESCSAADEVKKKPQSTSSTVSLNPEIHRKKMDSTIETSTEESGLSKPHIGPTVLESPDKSNASVVGGHLTSLTLPGKPESVVSFTSQCSYSSTIVHVGDKKTQPELEIIEDGPSGTEPIENQQSSTAQKNQEKEAFKKLGLTKEVLAVHTQKEEQSFLNKCKEIKRFHIFQYHCNYYFQDRPKGQRGEHGMHGLQHGSGIDQSWKKSGKNRKSKSKRHKPHESSDSTTSGTKPPHRIPLLGLNNTAWSPSDTSQASYSAMPFPAVMPAYTLPVFPPTGNVHPGPETSLSGLNESPDLGNHCPLPLSQFPAPLVTPVVALVLPNYVYPQVNNGIPQTLYPDPPTFSAQPSFSSQAPFTAQTPFNASNTFPPQTIFQTEPFHYNPSAHSEKTRVIESRNEPSRSCTPQSLGPQDQASAPLFQSRCSSPLQLNLLQLEEMPKVTESGAASMLGNYGTLADGGTTNKPMSSDDCNRKVSSPVEFPMEAQSSDAFSVSSDILDILLQEDASSGTGSALSGSGASAAAESLGSGSNGCGTSGSGTGSSETSHTSKYFGSIDSSENNHKTKSSEMEESEQFIKYVLQDPIWLLMANTDDAVMMTYQIPSRDLEAVLEEDKLKLKQMQKFQPKFTEEQKRELLEVHPWIQKGGLPEAVANSECVYCEENANSRSYAQDEEIHEMELNEMSEASGETSLAAWNPVVSENV